MKVPYADGMIKSVSIVCIPVRDQSKALEFYTKKLGFQILTDQPFGAQRWIEICVPGAETKPPCLRLWARTAASEPFRI